jgi:phosphoribosyl 1,2-cyclic phosphodiesterase
MVFLCRMMSLTVSSLNSGSNGNCYYIGNDREAVLVDAGLSCRETEQRMSSLGLQMQSVKAIIISHEHTDHIKGLELLSRRYALPVYISAGTLNRSGLRLDPALVKICTDAAPFRIGDMEIMPFIKAHDAAEPLSFVVACAGIRIGVFTDIGVVCEPLRYHFAQCHAAFLETNYEGSVAAKGICPTARRWPCSNRTRLLS